MTAPRSVARAALAALVAAAVAVASGCRARPTYEYEATETTISTAPPPGRAASSTTVPPRVPAWKRGEAR
jgi:hypothetical protein